MFMFSIDALLAVNINQLIWAPSILHLSNETPKIYPCFRTALVVRLFEKRTRLFKVWQNEVQSPLIQFVCFAYMAARCAGCQFVSYLATRGNQRIVNQNTRAKTTF